MSHILNQLVINPSTQRAQLSALYQKCGIPKTLFIWLQDNLDRYIKRREQIRVLSVFGVDPDSEVLLVNKLTSYSFRVRYILLLEERKNRYDQAIKGTLYLQTVQMKLSEDSNVKQVRERFDLVLAQELPHNDEESYNIITTTITKLREGGNFIIMLRNEGKLSEIQNDIFKKYAPSYNLFLAPKLHEFLKSKIISYESFIVDIPFIIPDKCDRNMFLTILLGIDVSLIPPLELENYEKQLLDIHDTVTIFDIPCGVYHSKNLSNIINHVDIPRSIWFPEGRFGQFHNIGKESWIKSRKEWLDNKLPHVDIPEQSYSDIKINEIICARGQYTFNGCVKLTGIISELAQYWKDNPE